MPRRPRFENFTRRMPGGGEPILYSRNTRTGKVSNIAAKSEFGPDAGLYGLFTRYVKEGSRFVQKPTVTFRRPKGRVRRMKTNRK